MAQWGAKSMTGFRKGKARKRGSTSCQYWPRIPIEQNWTWSRDHGDLVEPKEFTFSFVPWSRWSRWSRWLNEQTGWMIYDTRNAIHAVRSPLKRLWLRRPLPPGPSFHKKQLTRLRGFLVKVQSNGAWDTFVSKCIWFWVKIRDTKTDELGSICIHTSLECNRLIWDLIPPTNKCDCVSTSTSRNINSVKQIISNTFKLQFFATYVYQISSLWLCHGQPESYSSTSLVWSVWSTVFHWWLIISQRSWPGTPLWHSPGDQTGWNSWNSHPSHHFPRVESPASIKAW